MSTAITNPKIHELLSEASQCLASDQTARAKKLCEEAVRIAPSSADAHMVLADVLAARSENDRARKHYERATQCEKYHFGAWLNYGVFLKEIKERRNASLAFKNAVSIDPKSSLARYNLARALYDLGDIQEAVDAFKVFVRMEPQFPDGYHSLSVVQELNGEYDEALESAETSIRLNPELARGYLQIGGLYQVLGEFDKAETYLRKGGEVAPNGAGAFNALVASNLARSTSDDEQSLADIRTQLQNEELATTSRAHFLFAAAKILDRRGEFDEAFEAFADANAIRDSAMGPRAEDRTARWQKINEYFDADFVSRWQHPGNETDQPIFIIGMPRSGTTLTEQILASHPRVFGAGELTSVNKVLQTVERKYNVPNPDVLEKLTARDIEDLTGDYLDRYPEEGKPFDRVTDKMPLNLIYAVSIALAFPNAKLVYCRRNALDTCLSCFMQNFTNDVWFSFNQEKLAQHYRMHVESIEKWKQLLPGRIHEVRYEDLTSDPEPQIRSLLEHCDLEWDDACMEFHKTKRGIRTASVWQVRQPLYTSSVEKWRDYEKHLGPLIEGLGDLAET